MSIQFSYESQGQSSCLLAVFSPEQEIIQYQLEMLVNNNIKGLLPTKKRQKNDDIIAYYDITSRISFSQIIKRKKLTKKEFLTFLQGTIDAWEEVQEYQLECDGLYFEEDYIYVKPDTCEPLFVFLPVYKSSNGNQKLKEFIQKLILSGVVETTTDNFIQILLNLLSEPDFSAEKLGRYLKESKSKEKAPEPKPIPDIPKPKPEPIPDPPKPEPRPVPQPEPDPIPPVKDDSSGKGKKLFLLIQAGLLVVYSALFSFHAFTDKATGKILQKNLLAAILILAALEFVVYREIFVNSKKEKVSSKKEKKGKVKNKNLSSKNRNVEIPGREQVQKTTVQKQDEPIVIKKQSTSTPVQNQGPITTPQPNNHTESNGNIGETSLLSEDSLEFIDDGSVRKVPLDKDSIFIGRLPDQVDIILHNSNVGKIHAEIIRRNGLYYIIDQNSKNGTYINNGKRIDSNIPYPLSNNDEIKLADSRITIFIASQGQPQ